MKEAWAYQDGVLIQRQTQEVEPFRRYCKVMKDGLKEVPGLGYYAMTIPAVVIKDYMNRTGITYHEFMADNTHTHRLINDPDFKDLRIWEGRV